MKKQILFFVLIVLLSGCTYFGQNKPKKEYFTLWNTCEALTALQAYGAYAKHIRIIRSGLGRTGVAEIREAVEKHIKV